MLKKFLSFIGTVLLLGCANIAFSQTQTKKMEKFYEKQWKEVDGFLAQGLPKSAEKSLLVIEKQANAEKNEAQQIKVIFYKNEITSEREEESEAVIIENLEKELKKVGVSASKKAILHSLLAERYAQYLEYNRWKIYNRPAVITKKKTNIITKEYLATLNINELSEIVLNHYVYSLNNAPLLQNISVEKYTEIINKRSGKALEINATLYDIVAFRAINALNNSELFNQRPAYQFYIDNPKYFALSPAFEQMNLPKPDSLSIHWQIMKTFQQLTVFRQKRGNKNAVADIENKRLAFVYQHYTDGSAKENLYKEVMKTAAEKYATTDFALTFVLRLAEQYNAEGNYKQTIEICNQIISKNANSYEGNAAKNMIAAIQEQTLNVSSADIVPPMQAQLALVQYKNHKKIFVHYFKISQQEKKKIKTYSHEEPDSYDRLLKVIQGKKEVIKQNIPLPEKSDYREHSTEIKMPALPLGIYVAIFSENENISAAKTVSSRVFQVSELSFISKESSKEIQVHHRETGAPLQNVTVNAVYSAYNYASRETIVAKKISLKTNAQGYVQLEVMPELRIHISLINGSDTLADCEEMYSGSNSYKQETPVTKQIFVFTDRAIYRPSQTVFFKAILLEKGEGDKANVLKEKPIQVRLYDVNGQKIIEQNFTTNAFGSVSGSMNLPAGALNGTFSLEAVLHEDGFDGYAASNRANIQVEEYKRPKFEALFEPIEQSFKLGDEIEITGKAMAFAGFGLDNARVVCSVERQVKSYHYWWEYWKPASYANTTTILNDTLITDKQGNFKIKFPATADPAAGENREFIFTINADVTDQNGETHSVSTSVTVGRAALFLSANISEEVNIEKPVNLTVSATNAVEQPQNAKVKARLYSVKNAAVAYRNRLWEMPDAPIMSEADFAKDFPNDEPYQHKNKEKTLLQTIDIEVVKGSGKLNFASMETLPVGTYWVSLETQDKFGTAVTKEYMFKLVAPHRPQLAAPEIMNVQLLTPSVEPMQVAEILLATSEKNMTITYEVEHKGQIIKREQLLLNNEQRVISWPIKEEHRGDIAIHWSAVRHNRVYLKTTNIRVPYTNKDLKISFQTFRNKLMPGEKETWKLKISGHKADKVAAEMLATLYDASLETFAAHSLYMNIYQSYNPHLAWSGQVAESEDSEMHKSPRPDYLQSIQEDYSLDFSQLLLANERRYSIRRKGGKMKYKKSLSVEKERTSFDKKATLDEEEASEEMAVGSAMPAPPPVSTFAFVPPDPAIFEEQNEKKAEDKTVAQEPKKEKPMDVKARSNFSETAFFMPQLQTNENGEILIQFTIPEALTRWKMLGLAHTQNMDFGFAYNELVTQKDLMVIPNVPRFLREGDTLWLSTKITNLTEQALSGQAQLQLFDAISQKTVDNLFGNEANTLKFSCEKKESTSVRWKIVVPFGVQAVQYKIVAQAGNFSDGEEAILPVLTNRMLVTEALPLPIRGKQTKVFELKKLTENASRTAKNHALTLEFTQNPVWSVVQSLPYLMEYPYECAEQTFSRYYANALASNIVERNPKIKMIFNQWKNAKDTSAFLSNLQKNQELKSLMLQETPWVTQANREAAAKKQIAILFDMFKMTAELEKAMQKLEKMQHNNGAFPWFVDMPDNRYITQHIVAGIGHLLQLNAVPESQEERLHEMADRAIAYLDAELQKDYTELKKRKKINLEDQHISYTQLHYLYARSYFSLKVQAANEPSFTYYKKQMAVYWLRQPLYVQGMSALALHRYKEKYIAQAIVASLKEKALHSEEMGMYWKSGRSYYWHEAPIETHALMIEVFDEVAKDEKSVEDLKVFLLKNKQTNDWKTTKATSEACYALLLRGTNWLSAETKPIEIKLGEELVEIDTAKQEKGSGYFKIQYPAEQVKPEMGRVSVTKHDDGVAWGALYWQYFEQLDRITPVENNPLKIRKTLYKKLNGDRGEVMQALKEGASLFVGDMLRVRVEITTDRAMEYVHLKDLRASAFEPTETISGYKWQGGLGYYQTMKDASANFFIGYLPKGTFVFEYELRVAQSGSFSNGITSIQCMYAPEFTTHSEGIRVNIK